MLERRRVEIQAKDQIALFLLLIALLGDELLIGWQPARRLGLAPELHFYFFRSCDGLVISAEWGLNDLTSRISLNVIIAFIVDLIGRFTQLVESEGCRGLTHTQRVLLLLTMAREDALK